MGHHAKATTVRSHDGLDVIFAYGNRPRFLIARARGVFFQEGRYGKNHVVCRDDYQFSVLAGAGAYCTPRVEVFRMAESDREIPQTRLGPFTHVEVGYPSAPPEPSPFWNYWSGGNGVYTRVPMWAVRALAQLHGGVRRIDPPAGEPDQSFLRKDHFLCPRCGVVTRDPIHVQEGYCDRCRNFTRDQAIHATALAAFKEQDDPYGDL